MQGGRDPFFGFGDPFGSFGGFGGQRSLISSFFEGRDPFDDPFFARPFGSMFNSSFFGSSGNPFMNPHASGFLEHQPPQPNPLRGQGPIIEEIDSDDEGEDEKTKGKEARKENLRKHGRSNQEPIVEDPDDETLEKKSRHLSHPNDVNQIYQTQPQPQTHSFAFQSSSVSYGGLNGAYYSSSRTRKTGSDGFTFEEYKEADSSTRQASHRISRGIHDKGHSVSRKLKADGHVDTMQTLHNLNEDELGGFEEAWNGNARKFLPGWNQEYITQHIAGSGQQRPPNRGGWALPPSSMERSNNLGGGMNIYSDVRSRQDFPGHSGVEKYDVDETGSSSSRVRSNVARSFNKYAKRR